MTSQTERGGLVDGLEEREAIETVGLAAQPPTDLFGVRGAVGQLRGRCGQKPRRAEARRADSGADRPCRFQEITTMQDVRSYESTSIGVEEGGFHAVEAYYRAWSGRPQPTLRCFPSCPLSEWVSNRLTVFANSVILRVWVCGGSRRLGVRPIGSSFDVHDKPTH